ncbi:50S ribosomal protein L18 [Candidatus Parcubacteria bacterium]|nr:50S ribosomal protein L18 [Patescibacteria group bacterium]MBU4466493.1 50S ribosomal protein L18 [Patescibacteria group bacterium]MCG2688236.1 50S ribosomal protein L18 [Candidatus Parcubacteria bacterium]
MNPKEKKQKRQRRHSRIRAKIKGTLDMPRLSVFKSSQHTYAQLVDDINGKILGSGSSLELKKARRLPARATKTQAASEVGKLIADKAGKKKIKKVVFDRSGFKYHGRVKALAEAARKAGLHF